MTDSIGTPRAPLYWSYEEHPTVFSSPFGQMPSIVVEEEGEDGER